MGSAATPPPPLGTVAGAPRSGPLPPARDPARPRRLLPQEQVVSELWGQLMAGELLRPLPRWCSGSSGRGGQREGMAAGELSTSLGRAQQQGLEVGEGQRGSTRSAVADHPASRGADPCPAELQPTAGPSCDGRGKSKGNKKGAARGPRMLPGLLAVGGCWNMQCSSAGKGRLGRLVPTQACGGCRLARYCCPACQAEHWPLHRVQCGRWRRQQGEEGRRQERS